MAALFMKRSGTGASPMQVNAAGAPVTGSNLQSIAGPSYPISQGQIYGTDPLLMRMAMQRQMYA